MIRPFGLTTENDIKNEIDAMIAICGNEHKNIVTILHHGPLPSSDYHFIDMQFCELNLDDYINGERPTFGQVHTTPSRNFAFVPRDCSLQLKMQNIWTIMSEISDGLKFMHEKRFVHRDLKPRNSGTLEL